MSPQSWVLQLPPLFANDKALVAGCVSGYISSRFFPEKAKVYSAYMMRAALFTLKSVFVPVLPFLIFGFVLRMHVNGMLKILLSSYLSVFLVITVLCAIYLFILYGFVSRFNFKVFINTISNMAPAGFTGFTTVSSAATLPMTVICSKKMYQIMILFMVLCLQPLILT